MNETRMSGLTSEGRGFTLNSNKTNYSSHLYEDNAIYLKTIREELTEIQPIHGHFGDKININMFSVKRYPCKEICWKGLIHTIPMHQLSSQTDDF